MRVDDSTQICTICTETNACKNNGLNELKSLDEGPYKNLLFSKDTKVWR